MAMLNMRSAGNTHANTPFPTLTQSLIEIQAGPMILEMAPHKVMKPA